ncbi:hypothetical protein QUH32_26045, partial [Klebsiella pneumoniae]|nr:hypothetical protein [Klebsiella pneumoniae]
DVFAGKKSAQIREILISESAWEEMTCLFAPSLILINFHSNKKLDIVTAHSGCRNGMCMSHNDYGTRNLYAIK